MTARSNQFVIDEGGGLIIPNHLANCRDPETNHPCWAGAEPASKMTTWTPDDVRDLRARLCDDCRTRLDAADLLAEPSLPALPPVTRTISSPAAPATGG